MNERPTYNNTNFSANLPSVADINGIILAVIWTSAVR